MGTFIFGFISLAIAIAGVAICKADKGGMKRNFLCAPGVETVAGIAITAGFGFGIPLSIAGVAQYFF